MYPYQISCCSTADMPASYFAEHDIHFAQFHFLMDGKDYPDDLGKSMPFDEFYQRITDGAQPVTSQVSVGDYTAMFESALAAGQDVLHLALSSGISGTINSARVAQQQLAEKYPQRQIHVIDSLAASSGFGLMVEAARQNRDNGMSITENVAWLEAHKLYLHHWFFSTDLTSFIRGGRVSKVSGFVGQTLNICPLLNVNDEGKLIPRQKYRGKKQVIRAIVDRMEEHAEGGLQYSGKCFISQSACYEDARRVADLIEERFPNLDGKVMINSIGTVIGSHTGPGTVALFFWGDQRTR